MIVNTLQRRTYINGGLKTGSSIQIVDAILAGASKENEHRMRKKIELLAPAGGPEQFFAAVENGADAIYLGGFKFNARMKADNFTTEQLTEVIRYAHLRNVKIYITVNILMSDGELQSAVEYCTELYNMGADGIIVQDLGLASWVKNNLPNLALHLSTQGTVYNLSGVNAAQSLGFSRVVLARETTLSEVKKITNSSDVEIEIFVHGALCMCYSGQCQMSRIVGGINGRSGNRGLCAQPCRLPYRSNSGQEEYPLSPKDLCGIDHLKEIIDAGVTSLKIEGRMKSPEYVASVTGIYRKYLDEYMNNGAYQVTKNDLATLRQIYSRGEFTTGYLFGNQAEKLLTKDLPKHQGIYVGKIVNVLRGKNLIDIQLSTPLSLGDGIEIRNKQLTGNIVTYLKQISKQIYRIGDIKGQVEVGEPVYRITQASLMKEARKTYEGACFVDGKSHKRIAIDLELEMHIHDNPTLRVSEGNNEFIYTDKNVVVEHAVNKPLEKSLAERQLRKTGSTCFNVETVRIKLDEGSTLPLSALNKLRRDALDAYSKLKMDSKPPKATPNFNYFKHEYTDTEEKQLAFYLFDTEQIESYDFQSKMELLKVSGARLYLPLQDFIKGITTPDYLAPIPYISNISKGKLDQYIETNFTQIVDAVKSTGLAIGNLSWCREFANQGVSVYADYGLNLNNEHAKLAIAAMGVIPTYMSLESQEEAGWPIMITEHPIKHTQFMDRKKQGYHIIKSTAGDKWMLFKTYKAISNNSLLKQWKTTSGEFRIYIND